MTTDTKVSEFIDNFLEHRDDEYDARKAHEYYMRTRQLKGRQPAAPKPALSPAQMKDAQAFHARSEKFVSKIWEPLNRQWADLVANDKMLTTEKNARLKKLKPLLARADAQAMKLRKEYDSKPHLQKFYDIFDYQQDKKREADTVKRLIAAGDKSHGVDRRLDNKPGKVRGAQM